MTTTTAKIPTDEEFNAAIEKLEAVYGSDADPFVSVIETVRDEETVHDASHQEFTEGCMGCFTERLADAITHAATGKAA
jgi:hypothetical protein